MGRGDLIMSEEIDVDDPPILVDRGLALDRYLGDTVYALTPPGFGNAEFGEGIFGWD